LIVTPLAATIAARARPTAAVALVALSAASIAAATAVWVSSLPPERTPLVLAVLVLVVLLAPLALAIARGQFCVFDPAWPVLVMLAVQFPVQALYLVGIADYGNNLLPDRAAWARSVDVVLLIALGGGLAFMVGYAAKSYAARLATLLPRPRPMFDDRTRGVIVVLSAAGLVGYAIYVTSVGGLTYMLTHLSERNALSNGRYSLIALIWLFPIANVIWFAARTQQARQSWSWGYAIHLSVSVALLLTLGGRGMVLHLLLVLLALRFLLVKEFSAGYMLVVGLAAAVFLAAYGSYRQSTQRPSPTEWAELTPQERLQREQIFGSSLGVLLSPRRFADELFQYDYSSLDMMVLLRRDVPSKLPYQYGATLLDVFVRPVPSALYPGKPDPLNTQYNVRLLGGERGGKKASIIGEGYVNANVAGVLTLMFLYGVFARTVLAYRQQNATAVGAIVVYVLLWRLVGMMSGGGFGEAATYSLLWIVPVVGVLAYLRPRTASSPRAR
jgi:hypothetical protein